MPPLPLHLLRDGIRSECWKHMVQITCFGSRLSRKGKKKSRGYPYVKPDCKHDKGKADSACCSSQSGNTYASDDICCAAWRDPPLPGVCSLRPDVHRAGRAWARVGLQGDKCTHLHPFLGSCTHAWLLHPSAPSTRLLHSSAPIPWLLHPCLAPAPLCTQHSAPAPICTHHSAPASICTHAWLLHPSAPMLGSCTHLHPTLGSCTQRGC